MIKVILIYLIYLVNSSEQEVGNCFTSHGQLPKNGYRDFSKIGCYGLVLYVSEFQNEEYIYIKATVYDGYFSSDEPIYTHMYYGIDLFKTPIGDICIENKFDPAKFYDNNTIYYEIPKNGGNEKYIYISLPWFNLKSENGFLRIENVPSMFTLSYSGKVALIVFLVFFFALALGIVLFLYIRKRRRNQNILENSLLKNFI